MWLSLFLLLLPAAYSYTVTTAHIPARVGYAHVVDGDTLRLNGERIRLIGVDAPESKQTCRDAAGAEYACGQRATDYMRSLVADKIISCIPNDAVTAALVHGSPPVRSTDRYGRTLAACWTDIRYKHSDLGERMVKAGWAVAYRQYNLHYVPYEDAARTAKVGMWQGTFEMPWEYRHEHRRK